MIEAYFARGLTQAGSSAQQSINKPKMACMLPFLVAVLIVCLPMVVYGQGSCSPGFYSINGACQPCPDGSFCAGGSARPSVCGQGLTPVNATGAEAANCVTLPGHGYKVQNGTALGELCSLGKYNPGNNKYPCIPCPNNLTTVVEGSTNVSSCGAPRGYYVAGGNSTTLPCDKGTYQPEVTLGLGCIRCPEGSTTSNTASVQASDCKLALPGWYIAVRNDTFLSNATDALGIGGYSSNNLTVFQRCPPNTFNNGQNTATSCLECPAGTATRFNMYWYYSGYSYGVGANTEDMCAPLEEHVPSISVVVRGQQHRAYVSFSGSGSKYAWLWTSFENGPVTHSLSDAEMTCNLVGGHLPSLHRMSQAEHLIGTHMALWPRTNYWSINDPHSTWLGFFTNGSIYNSMYMYNWQASSYPPAWSDYSPADWPGMNMWNPGYGQGRVLQVVWGNSSAIDTSGYWWYNSLPYACAFNYTPSEVASSSNAVMLADRIWTLFTVQADYAAAVDICNAHGMQLASVHSAADNQALANLAANDTKWSGGHVGGSVLVGLKANAGTYEWQDGSPVDWSPEGFNVTQQPPLAPVLNYSRECVVVLANGSWAPVSCTRQPASFVCQWLVSIDAGDCAPGFYMYNGNCTACPSGSWCAGGRASPVECGEGLTTMLVTSSDEQHCGTKPGYGYTPGSNGSTSTGSICQVGTYNSAGTKRQCVPCPGSMTTSAAAAIHVSACGAPQGHYIAQDNVIRPCTAGTYQPDVALTTECVRCPEGSTTAGPASARAADCNLAWPGWYAAFGNDSSSMNGSTGTTVSNTSSNNSSTISYRRCPPNTFNNGLNTAQSCTACPFGTSTKNENYYYYNYGGMGYGFAANTEDMCAPNEEHVPSTSIVVRGQPYGMYTSYTANGIKYSWLWTKRFDEGPIRRTLNESESECALMGGHLPSLHSQAQAEHLIGTYMALWPRTNYWSYSGSDAHEIWLGFYAQKDPYFKMYINSWQDRFTSLAESWSDWSPPDWPELLSWDWSQARVLAISWGNSTTETRPRSRSWEYLPYACAFNYTPSEVASSSHAVMLADRTWTLFTVQADYAAAVDICNAHGMQLVSVHSAADNQALANLAANDTKWSGGHVGGSVLVGLKANTGTYEWQDGSPVDWSPEGFNVTQQPPLAPVLNYSRECVVVLANGSWAPVSCTRQPASFVCQNTAEGYNYFRNVWSNAHEAPCPTETYITATTKGQPIRMKLQTWGPDNSIIFAQVTVHVDEWNEHALRAMGFKHWSSAMIPLKRVAQLPWYAANLPAPGHDDASSDTCAVTAVVRQTVGSRVLLYARLAESPAGVYLEILGKLQGANGAPQPVRAVVKFLSSSMDNSTYDFNKYIADNNSSPDPIVAPQGLTPSPSPSFNGFTTPGPDMNDTYASSNNTLATPYPSPSPALSDPLRCYQFYPTYDINATTIGFHPSLQGMPVDLANKCDQLNGCAGFTTAGYLTSVIPDPTEWHKVTDDMYQGLYVKNCTGNTP